MLFNLPLEEFASKKAQAEIWTGYLRGGPVEAGNYSIPTSSLMLFAQSGDARFIPSENISAVTHYTRWVRYLYMWLTDNRKAQKMGKLTEQSINRQRRRKHAPVTGTWELIHNGVAVGHDDGVVTYEISSLSIRGRPLLASPDYVLREKGSGKILIVEVKSTQGHVIPPDGWPDMRAQLWAYGQIDAWKNAPEITLASEIWEGLYDDTTRLRQIVSWKNGEQPFEDENRKLFETFRDLTEKNPAS